MKEDVVQFQVDALTVACQFARYLEVGFSKIGGSKDWDFEEVLVKWEIHLYDLPTSRSMFLDVKPCWDGITSQLPILKMANA